MVMLEILLVMMMLMGMLMTVREMVITPSITSGGVLVAAVGRKHQERDGLCSPLSSNKKNSLCPWVLMLLAIQKLPEENLCRQEGELAPQEIPLKPVLRNWGQSREAAGAHGEEQALERGGRTKGSPAGSAIWCMVETFLAKLELTSLVPIPASAEGCREAEGSRQNAEVSSTGERCGASTTGTSPSGAAPPSVHWNAAQSLAKQGKARLSRKAN